MWHVTQCGTFIVWKCKTECGSVAWNLAIVWKFCGNMRNNVENFVHNPLQ